MAEGQWYYNLKTKQVEQYDGDRADNRMGPYNSRDEAEQALVTAQRRNEDWDNDPRFNDPDEDDEDDDQDGGIRGALFGG
ncbi:hypothetical protein GCM10027418_16040 [Mariniluteicoccus endophyticus]